MRVGRTIPPAAVPLSIRDFFGGVWGLARGQKEIDRFESELKEFFGVGHCFLVSSGKAALAIILSVLKDIHPNRKDVLIPAFCCYSVPSAIAHAGLKVRLCDVDPNTLDFDYEQLEEILSKTEASKQLLAVIPIHLFGIQSDIDHVRDLVKDPCVTIIEDAAQVLGSKGHDGIKVGTKGDVGMFSLGRGKAISAVEGGVVITNHEVIAQRIKSRISSLDEYRPVNLLNLFIKAVGLMIFQSPSLFWLPKALPFLKLGETIFDPHFKTYKLSAFQAGLTRGWLKKLEALNLIRKKHAQRWISIISGGNQNHITLIHNKWSDLIRLPIRASLPTSRDKILEESVRLGLGIAGTYPDSIDRIPELSIDFHNLKFPGAKICVHELATLPIHPFTAENDILKIKKILMG